MLDGIFNAFTQTIRDLKESLESNLKKNYFYFKRKELRKNFIKVTEGMLEIIYKDGTHCGNAIMINKSGVILTCFHCVNPKPYELGFRKKDGTIYPLNRVIAKDEDRDLALCAIDTYEHPEQLNYEPFFLKEISTKQNINVSLLSLRNFILTIKEGTTDLRLKRTRADGRLIEITVKADIQCIPGDSGGLVIDDKGRILGILTGGTKDGKVCYIIPWKFVLRFLKNLSPKF